MSLYWILDSGEERKVKRIGMEWNGGAGSNNKRMVHIDGKEIVEWKFQAKGGEFNLVCVRATGIGRALCYCF